MSRRLWFWIKSTLTLRFGPYPLSETPFVSYPYFLFHPRSPFSQPIRRANETSVRLSLCSSRWNLSPARRRFIPAVVAFHSLAANVAGWERRNLVNIIKHIKHEEGTMSRGRTHRKSAYSQRDSPSGRPWNAISAETRSAFELYHFYLLADSFVISFLRVLRLLPLYFIFSYFEFWALLGMD